MSCAAGAPSQPRMNSTPTLPTVALPDLDIEPFDVLEVRVARHQGQAVLEGGRRDPDVVLWNRPALSAKLVLELAISASCSRVTSQQRDRRPQLLQSDQILSRTAGLHRPVNELAKRHDRCTDLGGRLESGQEGALACKVGDDDVRVDEVSTSHSDRPVGSHRPRL